MLACYAGSSRNLCHFESSVCKNQRLNVFGCPGRGRVEGAFNTELSVRECSK